MRVYNRKQASALLGLVVWETIVGLIGQLK